jgi:hypothetical protein
MKQGSAGNQAESGQADRPSALQDWTPEQIALGRRWVQAWREAGPELERLRREELRHLDVQKAISLLCGDADYHTPPRAPKPTSGLVEQQRWFKKLAGHE